MLVSTSLESDNIDTVSITQVKENQAIFDIGPQTQALYREYIEKAQSILWNGPVGVFEHPLYQSGTFALAEAIASAEGFSLAGGGDTLAAINASGSKGFDYLSTGGGAMLAYCENKAQPGLNHLS